MVLLSFSCDGGLPTESMGVLRSGIIGGFLAPSPELDHTGAMIRIDRVTGRRSVICTATAIGEESAVTAKHCVKGLDVAMVLGDAIAWVEGPDIESRATPNRVVGVELPGDAPEPGALGMGYDVAVIHLANPVTTSALPKPFSSSLLRRSMVTLGYGMAGAESAADGRRRIGRETVVAVEGLLYEALYGSVEAYLGARHASDIDAAQSTYYGTLLMDGHELVTAALPGNTRACRGDSGGPLLQVGELGEWEIYGVLSGGPSSERAECDVGEVFATFGPDVQRFVDVARQWTDPCGALDESGECAGAVAHQCETDVRANVRRLVEEDCSTSSRRCQLSDGTARCVADPAAVP